MLIFIFLIICITYSIRLFDRHRGDRDHCGNVTESSNTLGGPYRSRTTQCPLGACAQLFLLHQDAYRRILKQYVHTTHQMPHKRSEKC